MKKIKYANDRNYRDFYVEEIVEDTTFKKRRPLLLNKTKGRFQRLKEKVATWFKL